MAMAKNTIGTLYDDNAVPIASGATGDGLSTYTGLNINNQTWNGTAYERTQSRQGAVVTTVGGVTTVAIAAGVATDTVVKATAGRLCKVLVTTTGTNPMAIWDNASGHTGTIIGALAPPHAPPAPSPPPPSAPARSTPRRPPGRAGGPASRPKPPP